MWLHANRCRQTAARAGLYSVMKFEMDFCYRISYL
jgi:hypothetical protein